MKSGLPYSANTSSSTTSASAVAAQRHQAGGRWGGEVAVELSGLSVISSRLQCGALNGVLFDRQIEQASQHAQTNR